MKTSFDDPAFWDRVLEKVERKERQKIIAQAIATHGPQATATKPISATAKWRAAVDACLPDCRGDRMRAVQMVNRSHPGLRERMLAEVNGR